MMRLDEFILYGMLGCAASMAVCCALALWIYFLPMRRSEPVRAPQTLRQRILEVLSDCCDAGMTSAEITDRLGGNDSSVRNRLVAMTRSGELTRRMILIRSNPPAKFYHYRRAM